MAHISMPPIVDGIPQRAAATDLAPSASSIRRGERLWPNWPIPGGGSPDMGNVSADGKELWVSGRYDGEVYVFDTRTGRLKHSIPVGREPHGLCVWPQPGRYSLGHTGNMR